jgi:hypothetical protein
VGPPEAKNHLVYSFISYYHNEVPEAGDLVMKSGLFSSQF